MFQIFSSAVMRRATAGFTFVAATLVGGVAAAQQIDTLSIIQSSRLFVVNGLDGDHPSQVGGAIWDGATSMVTSGSQNDPLYVIQNSQMYIVPDPSQSLFTSFPGAAGVHGAWAGDTRMVLSSTNQTPPQPALFVTQDSSLWRVTFDGNFVSLGPGWNGTTSMGSAFTSGGVRLFIIQDSRMWLVSPDTGAFSSLGSGWGGPTLMTTEGGFIYVIQDNTLWKVDPNGPPNHNFVGLTGAIWSGATSMTSTPDTLYVIRNSTLYRYDLVDDSLATESGPIWTGPTLMAGRFTFVK